MGKRYTRVTEHWLLVDDSQAVVKASLLGSKGRTLLTPTSMECCVVIRVGWGGGLNLQRGLLVYYSCIYLLLGSSTLSWTHISAMCIEP